MLAELTFRTSDPSGTDTVRCPLTLADWTFSAGYLKPVPMDGEIRIIPALTSIACPIAMPARLHLFPDPSTGELTLRIPSRPGDAVRITVVDMLGRTVLQRQGESISTQYQTALRISPAIPGTYILYVACGEAHWVRSVRVL